MPTNIPDCIAKDFRVKRYADGFYVVRPRATSAGFKKVSGPYNTVQIAEYAIKHHEEEGD